MSGKTDNSIDQPGPVVRKLGEGTYGLIIANPRIPSEGESYNELSGSISANNQVSKIIKDKDDIQKLNGIIDMINTRFSPSNLAQLQTHICIPTRPQLINWNEIYSNDVDAKFLHAQKINKRKHKWQYIMERGTVDLSIELRELKTINQLKHFLKGFGNIITGIAELHMSGLVHIDLKLTNMIVSWDGRYKLIDLDEISDVMTLPTDNRYFEKIYNNLYYPFYSLSGIFLYSFTRSSIYTSKVWDVNYLQAKIKSGFDKGYYKYFKDITKGALGLLNDTELNRIILYHYESDAAMQEYLTIFKARISTLGNNLSAYRELLLFIDRYALGINLLIILNKYYLLTMQLHDSIKTNHPKLTVPDECKCDYIEQSLVLLIKMCCNPDNYGVITTDVIHNEYNKFITQLFQKYPFKFIIKLLKGISIRRQ